MFSEGVEVDVPFRFKNHFPKKLAYCAYILVKIN